MQKRITLLIFLFLSSLNFSTSNEIEKVLHLKKISQPIEIDGFIEPLWSYADSSSEFFQFEPYYNHPPTVETTVKIISDGENLFCLFICYDNNPHQIQANNGMHDGFTGDIVSIMLDTFGDKQSAYKFAVNASGVTSDSRILEDGRGRDYTWDGIWEAASKIYDWGYVVEIKIPFKTIKFNPSLDFWGLDFDRWRSFNREDLFWCKYEQNEGQRVSKFGKLIFNDFKPYQSGLNLEIYPVGISKIQYQNPKYKIEPEFGLDITYNPSERLTVLFTANPDFAQIEADPFNFNISRYESYFRERRPFFTQGNEIFVPSGRENNSGFYSPLELFYSRRVGRILPNGKQVPLNFGTKIFGKIDDYDYGAFISKTGKETFSLNNFDYEEPSAVFSAIRLKKKIFENSSIGILFVSKNSTKSNNTVFNIDGVFRNTDWQLAYQFATARRNLKTDFAFSSGFRMFSKTWGTLFKIRGIGKNFDVSEIGFVPWRGTFNTAILTGPLFVFDEGYVSNIFTYAGVNVNYEDEDLFYDRAILFGSSIEMRNGWEIELNFHSGKNKDNLIDYNSYEINLNSNFRFSQKWNSNLWVEYSKTYNFKRNYLAFFSRIGTNFNLRPVNYFNIGSNFEFFIEGNPNNEIEDITFSARPFFSLTPINNLNFRIYVDNLYLRSSKKIERMIIGFLFSWNFSAKSWIYFAFNELKSQVEDYYLLTRSLKTIDRVGVFKIKYLYYF
ncbi:MAG: carbohydrate binding family 9 domain-containing protein [Ignavibacterium sp.]|nr:carbohydrate binding family 9 domain-containing protein [Ignavibacterium sp.]